MPDYDSTVPAGFRVIPGFPRFATDEHGTVLTVCRRGAGAGTNRPWTDAKRLKHASNKDGYRFVTLSRDGRAKRIFVHKLVLMTFTGPCPDGMECRHLDGCNTNNHIQNLAWGTSAENHRDKLLHGTSLGESNGSSKLTADDVLEIRRRAANGESARSIAKDFPVSQVSISKVVRRETWTHV